MTIGLPLAIAQAGAYLQQSGAKVGTYLKFYEEQFEDLQKRQDENESPLEAYPERSVWTTWTISYKAV